MAEVRRFAGYGRTKAEAKENATIAANIRCYGGRAIGPQYEELVPLPFVDRLENPAPYNWRFEGGYTYGAIRN